jgi:hypothetical protein
VGFVAATVSVGKSGGSDSSEQTEHKVIDAIKATGDKIRDAIQAYHDRHAASKEAGGAQPNFMERVQSKLAEWRQHGEDRAASTKAAKTEAGEHFVNQLKAKAESESAQKSAASERLTNSFSSLSPKQAEAKAQEHSTLLTNALNMPSKDAEAALKNLPTPPTTKVEAPAGVKANAPIVFGAQAQSRQNLVDSLKAGAAPESAQKENARMGLILNNAALSDKQRDALLKAAPSPPGSEDITKSGTLVNRMNENKDSKYISKMRWKIEEEAAGKFLEAAESSLKSRGIFSDRTMVNQLNIYKEWGEEFDNDANRKQLDTILADYASLRTQFNVDPAVLSRFAIAIIQSHDFAALHADILNDKVLEKSAKDAATYFEDWGNAHH